jgi:microcystin-dependent protein
MSTDFLGAVMAFAGNFAPKGYALAQGQLTSIQQNTALFSLLGTTYGGDGIRTFQLPDLRSRLPIGQGNGQGLSPRPIGELSGVENVTLLSSNVPPHNHMFNASTTPGTTKTAGSTVLVGAFPAGSGESFYAPSTATLTQFNVNAVGFQGGNQPHNNVQPSMAINYCVALVGIFPSRN